MSPPRTTLALFALLSATLVIAACGGSARTTTAGRSNSIFQAPPQAKLAASEYTALKTEERALVRASAQRSRRWHALDAACAAVGTSTVLLSSESRDCHSGIALLRQIEFEIPTVENRVCASATTTGARAACMRPLFEGLFNDAAAAYQADQVDAKVAQARGFGGRCLLVLGVTSGTAAAERQMMGGANQMVVTLSRRSLAQLEPVTRQLALDINRWSSAEAASPTALGVCRHA